MEIVFHKKTLVGNINLPSSKSISNRFLILKALAKSNIQIENLSTANDTLILNNILNSYEDKKIIDCVDAGTCFRFLVAYFSIQENIEIELTGTKRLQQRPIADLVNALRSLGAEITYLEKENFAPIKIVGKKLESGFIKINGNVSSQFISALCLIAAQLKNGLKIEIEGKIASKSYIIQTLKTLKKVGVESTFIKNTIEIKKQKIICQKKIDIEKDWSSACFFYCLAMLAQKNKSIEEIEISIEHLLKNSIQGDKKIIAFAKDVNIETQKKQSNLLISKAIKKEKIEFDFLEKNIMSYPDLAIPYMLVLPFFYKEIKLKGLENLVFKESNRIEAMKSIFEQLEISLKEKKGVLILKQKKDFKIVPKTIFIDTKNDHRIAMAGSLLAVFGFKIILSESKSVAKSFPNYWQELEKLGFEINS